MQTTVNLDEQLLRQAEQQAMREGKSLDSLVAEALQRIFQAAPPAESRSSSDTADGLNRDDPFFAALEEIRAHGRLEAARRVFS